MNEIAHRIQHPGRGMALLSMGMLVLPCLDVFAKLLGQTRRVVADSQWIEIYRPKLYRLHHRDAARCFADVVARRNTFKCCKLHRIWQWPPLSDKFHRPVYL